MREVITIQILRPNFEDVSPKDKQLIIEQMGKDIAAQITTQETLRHMNEDLRHWQDTFLKWQIEDVLISNLYNEEYNRTQQKS